VLPTTPSFEVIPSDHDYPSHNAISEAHCKSVRTLASDRVIKFRSPPLPENWVPEEHDKLLIDFHEIVVKLLFDIVRTMF
jgi:hypothetical protein